MEPIMGGHVDASPVAQMSPARPMRLLYWDKNGKLMMDGEAMVALHLVKGPVGVVSVLGRARQGKSFVLNQLLGYNNGNGFPVGASTCEPCTNGVWMWSTPLKGTTRDGVECSILLLDTEGIDAYKQTGNSSIPIYSLLVLVSSMLLCNQMGGQSSIDALDCLSQVMEMTKHLGGWAFGEKSITSELGQFSPVFVWLLRDFQASAKNNRQMTPRDYLDLALNPVQGGGWSAYTENALRKSVCARFPDRECFTLVSPVRNEKDVRHLDQLLESDFHPQFISGLDCLRKFVLDRTTSIPFGGSSMTGPILTELIRSFVDAINTDTLFQEARPDNVAVDTDNSFFVRKRKLEELMSLRREEAEIRARIARLNPAGLKILAQQKQLIVKEGKEKLQQKVQLRKKAYQNLQDFKGAIRVYLRICPTANEPQQKESIVLLDDDVVSVDSASYHFDKIFSDKSSQTEVFEHFCDLVQRGIDGSKVCIFTYGPSGTGKTYSMIGELKKDSVNAGLIPRALKIIFDQTKDEEYVIKLSVSEIYHGKDQSLMDPQILMDFDTAAKMLTMANKKRATKETKLNKRSSRSHCLFKIEICGHQKKVGEVCFIDLAGSERSGYEASQSEIEETKAINRSLYNLRQLLRSLATKDDYQNEKCALIKILLSYLSHGSKTAILATILPQDKDESQRTLQFVNEIKSLTLND